MTILELGKLVGTKKNKPKKKGIAMFALFNRNNMKAKKITIGTDDIGKDFFFRAYDQYNGIIILSPDDMDREAVTTVEEMDMLVYIGDNLKDWLAENGGEWGVQYFRMNGKVFIVNPMKNMMILADDKDGYARIVIQ